MAGKGRQDSDAGQPKVRLVWLPQQAQAEHPTVAPAAGRQKSRRWRSSSVRRPLRLRQPVGTDG